MRRRDEVKNDVEEQGTGSDWKGRAPNRDAWKFRCITKVVLMATGKQKQKKDYNYVKSMYYIVADRS